MAKTASLSCCRKQVEEAAMEVGVVVTLKRQAPPPMIPPPGVAESLSIVSQQLSLHLFWVRYEPALAMAHITVSVHTSFHRGLAWLFSPVGVPQLLQGWPTYQTLVPACPFKHGLCSSPTFLQPPVLVTAGNTWLWAGRPWKSHAGLCFALFPEEAHPTVRRQLQQLVGISEVHHLVASIVSILL